MPYPDPDSLLADLLSSDGRGRPSIYDKPQRVRSVTMPEDLIDYATQLGGGNFSAGVREALEHRRRAEGADLL